MSSADLVQQFLSRFQSLPPKTKLSIHVVKVTIKHQPHTKWYVLFNIIWQFWSSICFGVMPFKVPWVPTGMNTGRLTGPCGNVSRAVLAFVVEHFATASKVNALFIKDLIVMSLGGMQEQSRQENWRNKKRDWFIDIKVPIPSNWTHQIIFLHWHHPWLATCTRNQAIDMANSPCWG